MKNALQALPKTMSSIEIAKLTGKEHKNVIADIRTQIFIGLHGFDKEKMAENLAINEIQGVAVKLDKRGYWSSVLLDREHALTLVTGYDVKARHAVNVRWLELEQKELERQRDIDTRKSLRLEYKPMTDAIKAAHKEPKFFHYTNENDLIYRVALGCTAKKFKEQFEVESIRDSLPLQLKACILALQRANTVYIDDGFDFEKRHEMLESLYQRKWHDRIVEELILLEG